MRVDAIETFLSLHPISDRRLDQAVALAALRRRVPPHAAPRARGRPTGALWDDLHWLSACAEHSLSHDEARLTGAVYTPQAITSRIVAEAHSLWPGRAQAARLPRIADPACGAGAFLLSALRHLAERSPRPASELCAHQLRGVDVNPRAVLHARALLELACLALDERDVPSAMERVVLEGDALLEPRTALDERLWGAPHRADLLVGNPPYIKLQNIPLAARRAYARRFPGYATGSYSTALLFLVQMLELVDPQGLVGIITQNNLFTSLAGVPLRAYLAERGALRRVVDFGHHAVFATASAYTCLLYAAPRPAPHFSYAYESRPLAANPPRLERIAHSELDATKWQLGYRVDRDNLRRMESAPLHLGDVCRIRVGFATLKDRVFFVTDAGPHEARATLPDGAPALIERELTRPVIRVADFARDADLAGNRRRVIFPYRSTDHKHELVPWPELQQCWPRGAHYLETWRDTLLERDKGSMVRERWYAWGRSQSLAAPGPKLLTKTFGAAPAFLLDPSDSLFCNGYSLSLATTPLAEPWTLKALQRVLNSRVMHYFACLTSFSIAGGYPCFQKNFIAPFGLPAIAAQGAAWIESCDAATLERYLCDALALDVTGMEAALARYRGVAEPAFDD